MIAEPSITALQYTPGAGTPSALAKLPLLRRVHEAKKPLFVICAGELDPPGLAVIPEGLADPREADALARMVSA